EYLYLLKQQISRRAGKAPAKLISEARALLEVPSSICSSPTEFTYDARPILEHRRKVALMIERLQ
ncbi:MAG TPA: hypothetical protein VGK34_03425, partial [Armatimonadota bacterium]